MLKAPRRIPERDGSTLAVPVAAGARIHGGAIVCAGADGLAVPGRSEAGLAFLGVARESAVGLPAAEKSVLVRRAADFLLRSAAGADAVTAARIGRPCYIVDDEFVAASDGGGTRSPAGIVTGIEGGRVWVRGEASPAASPAASPRQDGGESLDARLDALERLTADLRAGLPATGWRDALASQGGVALSAAAATLAAARAAAYAPALPNAAGKHLAIRLLAADDPRQARVRIGNRAGTLTYELGVNNAHPLGASGGGKWRFYGYSLPLGDDVGAIRLQLTASAAHLGGSEFGGELTGAVADGLVGLDALAPDAAARLAPPETDIAILNHAAADIAIPAGAVSLWAAARHDDTAGAEFLIAIPVRRIKAQAAGAGGKVVYFSDTFNPSSTSADSGNSVGIAVTRRAGGRIDIARSNTSDMTLAAAWFR